MGLPDIFGEGVEFDGSAAFVGENFVNQLTVSVQKFGGGGGGMGGELEGVGEVPEDIEQ